MVERKASYITEWPRQRGEIDRSEMGDIATVEVRGLVVVLLGVESGP